MQQGSLILRVMTIGLWPLWLLGCAANGVSSGDKTRHVEKTGADACTALDQEDGEQILAELDARFRRGVLALFRELWSRGEIGDNPGRVQLRVTPAGSYELPSLRQDLSFVPGTGELESLEPEQTPLDWPERQRAGTMRVFAQLETELPLAPGQSLATLLLPVVLGQGASASPAFRLTIEQPFDTCPAEHQPLWQDGQASASPDAKHLSFYASHEETASRARNAPLQCIDDSLDYTLRFSLIPSC